MTRISPRHESTLDRKRAQRAETLRRKEVRAFKTRPIAA